MRVRNFNNKKTHTHTPLHTATPWPSQSIDRNVWMHFFCRVTKRVEKSKASSHQNFKLAPLQPSSQTRRSPGSAIMVRKPIRGMHHTVPENGMTTFEPWRCAACSCRLSSSSSSLSLSSLSSSSS